ncbi:MAG: hypothetical protein A2381_17950 [Bdellovibrionales bacterium RIFOXYB1_FULL_37_110]|nr:MAG: hypothetical protein A2417_08740 [Bdellovibrionales bacterium RIFOXYC1_FULL_37_79]OFZ59853.1 MAG: hypothetical protein A2381_17950 [Bdellovibrionales bacterium RIFOXYB1_FULL_37_110]OFZ63554.1 MAG: hypothetical protein A2328_04135 [Bdellovibrionales bacterium RIFOXYB2_FULL_36_6]OFZ65467.1 MAG: hypothetical protein A2577_18485 [Bdellovibrionales bacterium RIFOXYD1_FULL_36_51]
MKLIKESFRETLQILRKDKIVLLFSFVPLFIGLFLYGLVGGWLFNLIMGPGKQWVMDKISEGTMGSIAYYFLVTLVTVVLLVAVNYTFVLVVCLISCPFNDLISSRVYKHITKMPKETFSSSMSSMLNKMVATLLNESKKLILIIILSIGGFLLSFIPPLIPLSFIISAILLSVAFIDYNWSRDNLGLLGCFNNYKTLCLNYTLSGIIFLFVLSIPVVNLFCYPLAVIYYSVLYTKNSLRHNPKTGE